MSVTMVSEQRLYTINVMTSCLIFQLGTRLAVVSTAGMGPYSLPKMAYYFVRCISVHAYV